MRTWFKWSGAISAALLAGTALAADHRDGGPVTPGDMMLSQDVDINDVYTWMSDDNSELILVMSTGGLAGATEFSDAVQYVFHIGRSSNDSGEAILGPSADQTLVVCEFASPTTGTCTVGTPGQEAVTWVTGDLTVSGGATSDDGDMRVHAAQHADPFFFHLGGFGEARKVIVEGIAPNLQPAAFEASGCIAPNVMNSLPTVMDPLATRFPGQTYQQILAGLLVGANDPACTMACIAGAAGTYSVDPFATNDILGLVVQLDKTLIAGNGEFFQVYATTHIIP